MKGTRLTTSTAVAVALTGGLLVVSPLTGPATAAPGHSSASAVAHPAGFIVTGLGRVVADTSPGALVRDGRGGQHVVTTRRDLAASDDRGHVIYSTRQPGAHGWTTRELPGLRPLGGINVEAHLTFDRSQVFVVLRQCDGVYVTQVSLAGARLPTPTLVQAADNCAHPGSSPAASAPPTADAISNPGFDPLQISVLLRDPAQGNAPALFSGPPAGPFTASTALPTTDGFAPLQTTIDGYTGRIVVVGRGTTGGNQAIFETTSSDYGASWSTPTKIASLGSPSADYRVESVTAFGGSIWVGLLKPRNSASSSRPTLYLVHNAGSGQWFGAFPLPHTTGQDTRLQLAINHKTGTLHAAFTRVDLAAPVTKSGIMVETRLDGRWQQLKFLTHWAHDYTQSLTITGRGRAVIGYVQR